MPKRSRSVPLPPAPSDEVMELLEPDSRELLAVKCSRRPATCRCQACLAARWRARDESAPLRAMPPSSSDDGPPPHVTAREWSRWLVWCEAARRMYGRFTPDRWARAPRQTKAAAPSSARGSGGGWIA